MAYILKHKETSQVFSAMLRNAYNLPFYGVKYWNSLHEAEQEASLTLREVQINEEHQWELLEVPESRIRIFNVKLNNQSHNKLYLDEEGRAYVK